MVARVGGPAWYHPGGDEPRQGALIKKVHTSRVVDLILEDGTVAPLVPYHSVPDDPLHRHAYQPDPNDNVDLDAIRNAREDRFRIPGQDDAPQRDEPADPSDNGDDDGA